LASEFKFLLARLGAPFLAALVRFIVLALDFKFLLARLGAPFLAVVMAAGFLFLSLLVGA